MYVSKMQRLYGCCGLKIVAFGNLYFLQYSSDGEPHNLNILCSCSTWSQATQKLVMYHPENNTNFKRKKRDIGMQIKIHIVNVKKVQLTAKQMVL